MLLVIAYIILGVAAGALSGLVGVGGGIIIVPALVMLFHFSQKAAQGTTLALLIPPLGIFAAMTYYKAGYVNLRVAALIIVGFLIGTIISSRLAVGLPSATVSKLFGVFLLLIALRLIFTR